MIILSTLFFENGCWEVTAKILEREIKISYVLFYLTLKKCIASGYYCLQPSCIAKLIYLKSSAYFTFLIQIIEICQTVFSPVISNRTVTALEGQIEEHLKLFKQLFPDKHIALKQHYGIYIPFPIITLELSTRVSRFSFESSHSYFKELAQKQNFKNLLVFLAKCHQKMEYCNFIKKQLTQDSHSLFATEKSLVS